MSPLQAKYNKESGFTLIEALVSMVLLTTAIVPSFILASDAVKISIGIRNTLIASNLAQEGVEAVRALRDENWFVGQPFATGLDGCPPPTGCRVQWNSDVLMPIGTNTPLKWDSVSGLYQYTDGIDSSFSRRITIAQVPGSPDERVVTSEVTWTERSVTNTKSIVVESHLFDWIK